MLGSKSNWTLWLINQNVVGLSILTVGTEGTVLLTRTLNIIQVNISYGGRERFFVCLLVNHLPSIMLYKHHTMHLVADAYVKVATKKTYHMRIIWARIKVGEIMSF